ncbi:MAG: hypothetical protein ABSA78_18565 [Candidatus Sulfotelmatobacter sp.]|jgi:hypothetical protein
MKKTKGKNKQKAKKPAKQSTKKPAKTPVIESVPGPEQQVDIVEVRLNINNLVGGSAKDIVAKVIEVAKTTGQLASAKYLFEAVGLYPASEQRASQPKEDSLAQILLRRLGLPVSCEGEEDTIATGLAGDEKRTSGQGIPTAGGEDVAGPRGNGEQRVQEETTEGVRSGRIP